MSKYIEIKKQLDQRSNFFCPAKWTELFLYLNHGNTNSCHHPIPHRIPKELLSDPYVLHNTPFKLEQQQLMLVGQKPTECHMCWHIEEADPSAMSDRFVKGLQWKDDIDQLTIDPHGVPKLIEVVFDNLCNLNCSYCDSGQSSSWAAKLHTKTIELKTDYRQLYSKIHVKPGTIDQDYYQAWLKWWPEIRHKVDTLKISGGEPLISNYFWGFFDILGHAPQLKFSINSNLVVQQDRVQRLIDQSSNFKSIKIAVSIDGKGSIAEYARKGMNYQQLISNIEYWCKHSPDNCTISPQSTVNIFSIWGFADFLDLCAELRQRYPTKLVTFYSTLVRFPEFQSVTLLPKELRYNLAQDIEATWKRNHDVFDETEVLYINKILSYLRSEPQRLVGLDTDDLLSDLISFVDYYDEFGQHQLNDVFPAEFSDWIKLTSQVVKSK